MLREKFGTYKKNVSLCVKKRAHLPYEGFNNWRIHAIVQAIRRRKTE